MKANYRKRPFDIQEQIKKGALKNEEIDELYFYRNMYNAIEKLSKLYDDGYNEKKIYNDITSYMNDREKAKEFIELSALETNILTLLVGLNREALQEANSNTDDHSLFQYLNYESSAPVIVGQNSMSANNYSKELCKWLGFNKNKNGPFPYMLDILKTDNRNRPYDCITKIRNALQHAEYFQKKGIVETIHITNHDGDNLVFEGDLLLWSYRRFVEDFYGVGLGVAEKFYLYKIPQTKNITDKEQLVAFLKDFSCISIRFKKVPDKYKFKGQEALFSKLNQCFGLNSLEQKDILETLDQLVNEGLEFGIAEDFLTDDVIDKIVEYLENKYKDDLYNDNNAIKKAEPIAKLIYCPNSEISNCLSNILRYIDMKKLYLTDGSFSEEFFDEQYYDQNLTLAFQYTIMLIKSNIISYALECDKFERMDLSSINLSELKIFPEDEYKSRVQEDYLANGDISSSHNFIALQGIRNAIAHGNERLTILSGTERQIAFSDTFDSNHKLHVAGGMDSFVDIFSNHCFNPDNIKTKDKAKVKIKISDKK